MIDQNNLSNQTTGLESLALGSCPSFVELMRLKGLRFALHRSFERVRFIAWLWLLRECQILKSLTVNYAKVPSGTPSKIIVWPFAHSAFLRKKLVKLDLNLQKRLVSKV